MERDILEHKYVEHGEFNFNLYGTRVDSCWDVVKSGKMCVLDVSPAVSVSSRNKESLKIFLFCGQIWQDVCAGRQPCYECP